MCGRVCRCGPMRCSRCHMALATEQQTGRNGEKSENSVACTFFRLFSAFCILFIPFVRVAFVLIRQQSSPHVNCERRKYPKIKHTFDSKTISETVCRWRDLYACNHFDVGWDVFDQEKSLWAFSNLRRCRRRRLHISFKTSKWSWIVLRYINMFHHRKSQFIAME